MTIFSVRLRQTTVKTATVEIEADDEETAWEKGANFDGPIEREEQYSDERPTGIEVIDVEEDPNA